MHIAKLSLICLIAFVFMVGCGMISEGRQRCLKPLQLLWKKH